MMTKGIIVLKKTFSIAASPRLTAVCLVAMICMVISGTLYEASHGLLAARERFFQSWFSLALGVIPFPGIRLIALVLLINLLFKSVTFFRNLHKNSGLLIMHGGVAMLLTGALLSSNMAHEYILPLGIGETSDTALNFSEDELFIQSEHGDQAGDAFKDTVIPVKKIRKNQSVIIGHDSLIIDAIHKHTDRMHNSIDTRQSSEIILLHSSSCQSSVENKLVVNSTTPVRKIRCNNRIIHVEIRPVTKKLPVNVTLKDFTKQLHQGTQTLKYVQSNVIIKGTDFVRDAVITMNKPLRYGNYTFYQSSYSEQQGRMYSSFSVVYNPYKITPYIASLTIIGGGLLHAILMIIAGKRKRGITGDTL